MYGRCIFWEVSYLVQIWSTVYEMVPIEDLNGLTTGTIYAITPVIFGEISLGIKLEE